MTNNADPQAATGGDIIAEVLLRSGVTRIFTLHGGHLDALFYGAHARGIQLIDTRHEASAGHAAQAYALLTRQLGVCVVTAGPGFANAYAAILNAQADCAPVLFIVGAPPTREEELNVLQAGVDHVACARPACKWVRRVARVDLMAEYVGIAIREALSGRPGPVVLEVPIDIMFGQGTLPVLPDAPEAVRAFSRTRPDDDAIVATIEMLRQAERPAIVMGSGAKLSGAGEALCLLAERSGIPVLPARSGYGLMPPNHPLDGKCFPSVARDTSRDLRPDAVLLVGTRLGKNLGGRTGSMIAPTARVAQIDVLPAEIGRVRAVDIALPGDCRTTLMALADEAARHSWPARRDWVEAATTAHGRALARFAERYGQEADREDCVHPYAAAVEVARALHDARPLAVLDGAESALWIEPLLADIPGAWTAIGGPLGFIGTGLPFAIGYAHAGIADRPVVHLTGDGSFGFHPQELDTLRRHGGAVLNIVFNNQVWGMSRTGQLSMYPERGGLISSLAGSRYAEMAQGLGVPSQRVTRRAEIGPAVRKALASGAPALIEIMTDSNVSHPATAQLIGADQPGPTGVVVPYYENF